MDCAMSSGLPTRPAGVAAANLRSVDCFCSAVIQFHQGVSMTPGDTAFTRRGRSSTASGLTRLSMAELMAARPAVPGLAARADMAETKVIEPDGLSQGRLLRQRKMRPELRVESGAQIGRCDLGEGSRASSSAERHHEVVEPADLGQGTLSVFRIRGVERADGGLCAELLLHRFELGAIPAIDHRCRAAFDQEPGRGQADSG